MAFRYTVVEWYKLQQEYLSSDKQLAEFSFEYSQDPNRPFIEELKKKARQEGWEVIKDELRLKTGEQVTLSTSAAVRRVLEDIRTTTNSLEYLHRTIQFSKEVQNGILDRLPGITQALKTADLYSMPPNDLARFFKDLIAIFKAVNEIEQKALGVVNPQELMKLALEGSSDISLSDLEKELSAMDDQEITAMWNDLQRNK